MALTDRAEEILESLWIESVERKKDACDIGVSRNDEGLREVADLGYVTINDSFVSLSTKGKREAKNCVRRHRLAERLMVDVLDAKSKTVHQKSCKFEHLLHEGLDESICTLLGHPSVCPHGRPIPAGRCCREAKKTAHKLIMPLADLGVGNKAVVAYLHSKNRSDLQKLLAMGVLPNMEVTLTQSFPSHVFQIGRSQFAIDKELASNIIVRIV